MNHPTNTLYVLADGARARFVERRRDPDHFVTIREMDARPQLERLRQELRATPATRTVQSGSPDRRHTTGRSDQLREAKIEFMTAVAGEAKRLFQGDGYADVFIAAPNRLLPALRQRISDTATIKGGLDRDLTKTPDSDLSKWLAHTLG